MPTRKRTLRVKKQMKQMKHKNQKRVTKRRRRVQRGGNYETDITTRTYMGIPVKPLNKITATIPGFPVMSGASFYKHQEYEDFHGKDDYD